MASVLKAHSAAAAAASFKESSATLPYVQVQASFPSTMLSRCAEARLSWAVMVGVRSWCRLRASFVELRMRSSGRVQACIFCGGPSRNALVHVLGKCRIWNEQRTGFRASATLNSAASPETIAMKVLTSQPEEEPFSIAVEWSTEIDKRAQLYWRSVIQGADE